MLCQMITVCACLSMLLLSDDTSTKQASSSLSWLRLWKQQTPWTVSACWSQMPARSRLGSKSRPAIYSKAKPSRRSTLGSGS